MTDEEKVEKAAKESASLNLPKLFEALNNAGLGSEPEAIELAFDGAFRLGAKWRDENPGPDTTRLIENFTLIMKRWRAQVKFGVMTEDLDQTLEKFGQAVEVWQAK